MGKGESAAVVEHVCRARLPTPYGDFTAHVFRSRGDGHEHVVLVRGAIEGRKDLLVRVHSECITGEVFSSGRCDCGEQLDSSLALIAREGCGAVIYLRGHEGRGIGLANKLRAYALQDAGRDTIDANLELGLPADARDYAAAAGVLHYFSIPSVRLLTNNPAKVDALRAHGVGVTERQPVLIRPTPESLPYLRAKQQRMGHLLELDATSARWARAQRMRRVLLDAPTNLRKRLN